MFCVKIFSEFQVWRNILRKEYLRSQVLLKYSTLKIRRKPALLEFRYQFHLHLTRSIYLCRSQKHKVVNLSDFFALSGSECTTAPCKTLLKLTPGINFIYILSTAFTSIDPKSAKRYWWLYWIFTLLGSLFVKDGCKHVGEIDHS